MDKKETSHSPPRQNFLRLLRDRLSKPTSTFVLLVSLAWLVRPQPVPANSQAASFPVIRPSDSGEFPKLKTTHYRAWRAQYKPQHKAMPAKKHSIRKRVVRSITRSLRKAQLVVIIAKQYLGVRYVYGGNTPSGFDCSGYTRWVYAKVGVSLPRTARSQAWMGRFVRTPSIGDLVFWNQPASHVGIYVGHGMFIAAPHTGTSVRIAPLYGSPYFRRVL